MSATDRKPRRRLLFSSGLDEFLVYYNQKENKILQDKDIILNSLDFFVNSDIECSCLHELKCIFNIKDNYYKFENPVKECNQFIFHYWEI